MEVVAIFLITVFLRKEVVVNGLVCKVLKLLT
jgi:hypothetical protein